jgi:hypothetical protein
MNTNHHPMLVFSNLTIDRQIGI